MAKPGKPEKPAEEDEATDAPPKKGRKKLIVIIIAVAVLVVGGGVAAFLLIKPSHDTSTPEGKAATEKADKAEEEALAKNPAKYVDLGTFTANLVREDGDQYLQVAITLKLTRPDLEEKVKTSSPEIMHRVNMLLQSKRASELVTYEDKTRLGRQIKEQVEYVLRLRKNAPVISSDRADEASAEVVKRSGVAEVLFTSFIIQ
ncbi:MAG: flagellar basal body-associated FliL family protein [Gallionella sp.]|nr:flagellar basal body-associated FliL family protein [Gallionella sp.]